PFGARIDYAKNWIGRYQSLVSSLTDIAVEPSVAWSVTRKFSVCGGLVIDYMHVRETQAVRPALGGQYGDIIGDVGGTDYGLGY
ncbi:outer membrane protein transport protein, partial [Acinetobacter baumannii]